MKRRLALALGLALLVLPGAASAGIRQIVGPQGNGTHPLEQPNRLATAPGSVVFVSGRISDNILRIESDGTKRRVHPFFASDMASDAAGNLYVCSNGRLKKIAPDGTKSDVSLTACSALDLDAAGNVYVGRGSSVWKIPTAGPEVEILDASGDGVRASLTVSEVAVSPSGAVYALSQLGRSVFEVSPGGAIRPLVDTTGDGRGHGFDWLSDVAVDPQGRVYVAGWQIEAPGDIDGHVLRVDPSQDPPHFEVLADLDDVYPQRIAFGAGLLAVSAQDFASEALLLRIRPGFPPFVVATSAGDGTNPLGWARDAAVDEDGRLYVAGYDSDNAFRVGPAPVPIPIGGAALRGLALVALLAAAAGLAGVPRRGRG